MRAQINDGFASLAAGEGTRTVIMFKPNAEAQRDAEGAEMTMMYWVCRMVQ